MTYRRPFVIVAFEILFFFLNDFSRLSPRFYFVLLLFAAKSGTQRVSGARGRCLVLTLPPIIGRKPTVKTVRASELTRSDDVSWTTKKKKRNRLRTRSSPRVRHSSINCRRHFGKRKPTRVTKRSSTPLPLGYPIIHSAVRVAAGIFRMTNSIVGIEPDTGSSHDRRDTVALVRQKKESINDNDDFRVPDKLTNEDGSGHSISVVGHFSTLSKVSKRFSRTRATVSRCVANIAGSPRNVYVHFRHGGSVRSPSKCLSKSYLSIVFHQYNIGTSLWEGDGGGNRPSPQRGSYNNFFLF